MRPDPVNTLVTVVGGSGFLGRSVVHSLAQAGYRIRVTSRHPALATHLLPAGKVGQIALVRADIRDETSLAAAINGAQHVVNLVGILKESGGRKFAAIHAEGTGRVAALAAKTGVRRVILISAIGASKTSRSAYARTKAEGEERACAAFPDVTVLRPSIIFGPGDSFFTRFAALMRLAPVFPLFGGGSTKFQPVFAGDVADAVVNAIADDGTRGRTYELGGPAAYSFKELLAYTALVTERKRAFMPIPFLLLDLGAALTGWLPFAPITLDQARQLRVDNVVGQSGDVGTLKDLGVAQPTAIEAVVPSYLYAYRRTGQYAEPRGV